MPTRKTKQESAADFEIALSVLGFQEAGQWVALALEMDIRGHGESFEDAVEDLTDLVLMQLSFAHFKGQPELINRPADAVWWKIYASLWAERLRRIVEKPKSSDYRISTLVPDPHVIDALSRKIPASAWLSLTNSVNSKKF